MSWAFTVYDSYGTLEEIRDYCLRRFKYVAVFHETTPYSHFHGMLGCCRKGVEDNYKNTQKWLWKLKKTSNFRTTKKAYLSAVHSEKAYEKYISKMDNIECNGWSNFKFKDWNDTMEHDNCDGSVSNWNNREYGFDEDTLSKNPSPPGMDKA